MTVGPDNSLLPSKPKAWDHALANALMQAANTELQRFAQGLPILDTAITLAPLLGLLGTVTGMIHAFGLLGSRELEGPLSLQGVLHRL